MSQASKYRRRLAADRVLRIEAASLGVRPKELQLSRAVASVLAVDESIVIEKARQMGINTLTLAEARRMFPVKR